MFGRSSSSDPAKPMDSNRPAPPTPPASLATPMQAAAGGFMPAGPAAAPDVIPVTSAAPAQGALAVSLIGRDLSISGEKIHIVSNGRLQVDGEIIGDLTGREVVVGDTGRITGSISAESIDVRGVVDGGIRGSSVSLKQSARVSGDIVHQTLSIAEGAQFDGRVRRAKDNDEVRPDLSAARKPSA